MQQRTIEQAMRVSPLGDDQNMRTRALMPDVHHQFLAIARYLLGNGSTRRNNQNGS